MSPTTHSRRNGRVHLTLVGGTDERPRTRGDCVDGPRPCPWRTCRYHLADMLRRASEESCALDVADRGGATLEELGEILGVTRERVRQLEAAALFKVRRQVRQRTASTAGMRELVEDAMAKVGGG